MILDDDGMNDNIKKVKITLFSHSDSQLRSHVTIFFFCFRSESSHYSMGELQVKGVMFENLSFME